MSAAFRRFPAFATRPRRGLHGKRTRRRNLSQAALQAETLEPRAMLSITPVQMESGADNTKAVRYETDSSGTYDITDYAWGTESIVSRDIHGRPIDFDQDGRADVLFVSAVDKALAYYKDGGLGRVIATSREALMHVGFGSPQGFSIPRSGPSALIDLQGLGGGSITGVFDVNADGYLDIVSLSSVSTFVVSTFNPQTRNFDRSYLSPPSNTSEQSYGRGTYADFTGDGVIDLALPVYTTFPAGSAYSAVSAFRVYSGITGVNGTWNGVDETSMIELPVGEIIASRLDLGSTGNGKESFPDVAGVARDFDNDGDIDLALPTNTGIRIFTNPGNGQFDATQFVAIDNVDRVAGLYLIEADFNGDGLLDLASSPNANCALVINPRDTGSLVADAGVGIYLNTSTGSGISMQPATYRGLAAYGIPAALSVGDFNLDGHADLAVAFSAHRGTVYAIAAGDGTGAFPSTTIHTGYRDRGDPLTPENTDRAITAIAVGDYDGDGQEDVAVAAAFSGYRDNVEYGMSLYGVSYNSTFAGLSAYSDLPAGQQGVPYVRLISGTGGDPSLPYSYALSSLSSPLPDGLTLGSDGRINGVPSRSGSFEIAVDIAQSNGLKATSLVSLSIAPSGDNVQPSVVDIGSIAPNPRNKPLDSVSIRFSEPLSPATFTAADLSLTLNGQPVSLAGVSITTADNTVFSINGLASATDALGAYQLTVDARGVTDVAGNVGNNQLAVDFVRTNFDSVLTLTDDGRWILSTSDGTQFHNSIFARWATTDVNGAPLTWTTVLQGDVDGDGLTDVIGRTNIGQWWATINNGDGTGRNQLMGYWKANTDFYDIVAADFNGDGRTDVAGRTATGQWWSGIAKTTGNGFDTQRFGRWNSGLSWSSVLTGDFDGDGRDDIAGLADNGHWWGLLGQSDGTGASHLLGSWDLGLGFRDVVAGDFNGDGRTDIAGRSDGGTWWAALANSATIGFTNSVLGVWSAGTQWNNVVTGDFDGDGLTDIAGRGGDGAWWGMYSNGSAGPRSSRIIGQWDPTGRWAGVVTGDADGDGRSDIVGRNATTLSSARGRFSTSLSAAGVLATQAWGSINTPDSVEARAVFFSRF